MVFTILGLKVKAFGGVQKTAEKSCASKVGNYAKEQKITPGPQRSPARCSLQLPTQRVKLGVLAPKSFLGARNLQYWVLGPSGQEANVCRVPCILLYR